MPLALLLQERLGVMTVGLRRIASFGTLMDKAVLILRRRQGSFLVSWFGPRLRVDGLDLVVAASPETSLALRRRIARARDLQGRYARWSEGPNLLEPTAGLSGVLVGLLVGGLAGSLAAGLVFVGFIATIHHLIVVIMRGLSLKSGWGALRGATENEPSSLLTSDMAGRYGAQHVEAVTGLLRDITGNRLRKVKPTTVRQALLELGDRVAALMAQVLGAAATFLSLLPMVRVLRKAEGPLRGLVEVAEHILTAAVTWTIWAIEGAVKASGIKHLPAMLGPLLRKILKSVVGFLAKGIARLRFPYHELAKNLKKGWQDAAGPFVDAVESHAVVTFVKGLKSLGTLFAKMGPSVKTALGRIGTRLIPPGAAKMAKLAFGPTYTLVKSLIPASKPKPPSQSVFTAAWKWVTRDVPKPPSVVLPALVSPTDMPALLKAAKADELAQPLNIVGTMPRVFPPEARRLEDAIAKEESDPTYRAATAILDAAAQIAGPLVDTHVTKLTHTLDTLEADLRRRPRQLATPVKTVPPPRRLVPVLRKVRVIGEGVESAVVRTWFGDVVRHLQATPFAVPATGKH
ncbi:MAG: hypothetical protein H0V33_01525 [Acidimicrobiia bacterium]|jgi:hypothetical protein|nr:hypothetical protein [Acidimicrobiia bacterium]